MRAFIYTRFSPRPDAKDCDSCEKQGDRCVEFCVQKNWDYVSPSCRYSDGGVSGVAVERPGLNGLIADLGEAANRCAVVIDSPDRLARDLMVGLILRERITRAGGVIAYADGSPSGDSPEDKFISNMMLALATLERDRVSYRTSRGLKKRQASGEFFGKPPIGWMRVDGKGTKLVPHKKEREAILAARNLFDADWPASAIAQRLEDDFGEFRGGCWKAKTVRKMANKVHAWEKEGDETNNNLGQIPDVIFKTSAHSTEPDHSAE